MENSRKNVHLSIFKAHNLKTESFTDKETASLDTVIKTTALLKKNGQGFLVCGDFSEKSSWKLSSKCIWSLSWRLTLHPQWAQPNSHQFSSVTFFKSVNSFLRLLEVFSSSLILLLLNSMASPSLSSILDWSSAIWISFLRTNTSKLCSSSVSELPLELAARSSFELAALFAAVSLGWFPDGLIVQFLYSNVHVARKLSSTRPFTTVSCPKYPTRIINGLAEWLCCLCKPQGGTQLLFGSGCPAQNGVLKNSFLLLLLVFFFFFFCESKV